METKLPSIPKSLEAEQAYLGSLIMDSSSWDQVSHILEAKDFFLRENINIETHLIKNCGHHIPIEASSIALNYILKKI